MQRLIYGPFLILLLTACGSNAPEGTMDLNPEDTIAEYQIDEERITAVDFNNQLSLMQEDALNQITILFQSDSATVDQNYDNALFELEIYSSELEEMKTIQGGDSYLEETKKLIDFYKNELKDNFIEIKPLLKKSNLSDQDLDRLDEYDRRFAEKEQEIFDAIFEEQEKFAEQHNIQLQDH